MGWRGDRDTEMGVGHKDGKKGMGTEMGQGMGMETCRWERASGLGHGVGRAQGQSKGTERGQHMVAGTQRWDGAWGQWQQGLTGLPIAAGPPALLVGAGPGVGALRHRLHQAVHDLVRGVIGRAGDILLGWGALGWGDMPCPCVGGMRMLASAGCPHGPPRSAVPSPTRSYPGWVGCVGQGHRWASSGHFSCSHGLPPPAPAAWGWPTPQQAARWPRRCRRTSRSAGEQEVAVGDTGWLSGCAGGMRAAGWPRTSVMSLPRVLLRSRWAARFFCCCRTRSRHVRYSRANSRSSLQMGITFTSRTALAGYPRYSRKE